MRLAVSVPPPCKQTQGLLSEGNTLRQRCRSHGHTPSAASSSLPSHVKAVPSPSSEHAPTSCTNLHGHASHDTRQPQIAARPLAILDLRVWRCAGR